MIYVHNLFALFLGVNFTISQFCSVRAGDTIEVLRQSCTDREQSAAEYGDVGLVD
jgi:hypothetical protein